MNYEIKIETVAERPIAASRQRTTFKRISKEIGALLGFSWAYIGEHPGIRTNGDNVAIYWDDSGEGSIEVGVQVVRQFEDTDKVVCSATPAGMAAATSHWGPYSELIAAHKAVRAWCAQNGHEIALPFWEIYGDWNDDPAKLRTDVLYLLKTAHNAVVKTAHNAVEPEL